MFGKKKAVPFADSEIRNPDLIGMNCLIRKSVLNGNVVLGDHCRINEAYLTGEIAIGRYSSLWGPGVDVYALLNPVVIGSFCSIARYVSMQEYNHITDRLSTYFIEQNVFGGSMRSDVNSKGGITIGNDVWIGAQCVILSGVTIGDGCVIAANSVVSSDLPPYSIAAGSPAKVIRSRFSEELVAELLTLQWWNWDIEKIKRNRAAFEGPLTLEKLHSLV